MVIRSFLAFEIPEEIKDTLFLIYDELKNNNFFDVRWVKKDNLHITLIFMGNIEEKHIDPISNVVEKACNKYAPFLINIKGIGVFPNLRNPRVLWIGIEGEIERMGYFRDHIQKGLRPFHIKEEKRRFSPHLTIARFKKGFKQDDINELKQLIESYKNRISPDAMLKELVLFKSDLRPEGAIYTKLNSWHIQGKK